MDGGSNWARGHCVRATERWRRGACERQKEGEIERDGGIRDEWGRQNTKRWSEEIARAADEEASYVTRCLYKQRVQGPGEVQNGQIIRSTTAEIMSQF